MGLADREAKRAKHSVVASILHTEPMATGKGRPKSARETKQRISLMILPSLYQSVKKIAFVERRSVSELIAECLAQYVQNNQHKLEQFKE